MNLTVKKRKIESKGEIKKSRRDNKIPAIFYSPKKGNAPIEIDRVEFDATMRKVKKNHLSTTVFTLDIEGKKTEALCKGIQYDRTSYSVLHLDFIGLNDSTPVSINVPVECIGVEDCVGIKLGGALRQVIRNIRVKCLPKNIPNEFRLDIRDLKMKQSKRISDLKFPDGVKPVGKADEVIAVIAKR